MKKRILSLLLCLVLCLSLMPMSAFADGPTPVTEYDLWVGDTQVTAQNYYDVLGDGTVS